MDILYKTYEQGDELLLAACDKELLGSKFKEGEICLNVKSSFYGGEDIDEEGLSKIMEDCTVANLVGERTVRVAIELGFGKEEDILRVKSIPHLQIVRLYV